MTSDQAIDHKVRLLVGELARAIAQVSCAGCREKLLQYTKGGIGAAVVNALQQRDDPDVACEQHKPWMAR
jgi:hypothetical protein